MESEKNFLCTINEQYPFERYILKEPVAINYLFDDVYLTELFVPDTEIKVISDYDGCLTPNSIDCDEVYVKIRGSAGEMRFAYYDFNDRIREMIMDSVIQDFGHCEWQDLYVENEDDSDLKDALRMQYELIRDKYGECHVKQNFKQTDIIKLVHDW